MGAHACPHWPEAAKHHQPGARRTTGNSARGATFHQTAVRKVLTKIARAFWYCYSTGVIREDEKLCKPASPDLDEWVMDTQSEIKARSKTQVTAK